MEVNFVACQCTKMDETNSNEDEANIDENTQIIILSYFNYFKNAMFIENVPVRLISNHDRVARMLSIIQHKSLFNKDLSPNKTFVISSRKCVYCFSRLTYPSLAITFCSSCIQKGIKNKKNFNKRVLNLFNYMEKTRDYIDLIRNLPKSNDNCEVISTDINGEDMTEKEIQSHIELLEKTCPQDLLGILFYVLVESLNVHRNHFNLNLIKKLSKNIIRLFFRLLLPCPEKQPWNKTTSNFKNAINDRMFKLLLRKWNGWHGPKDSLGLELSIYLSDNLNKIEYETSKYVKMELCEYEKDCLEDVLYVSTQIKNLKTFFYYKPQHHLNYYNLIDSKSSEKDLTMSKLSLFNWPYITTQINMPNFSMIHRVITHNKFKLINLTEDYKVDISSPLETDLYCKEAFNAAKPIPAESVLNYLNQLETNIREELEQNDFLNEHDEFLGIVKELQKDVSLCSDTITLNTDYRINLWSQPYIRFLGDPESLSNTPTISINNQLTIGKADINVRLEQYAIPTLSFILKSFYPMYGKNVQLSGFIIQIIYNCTLCNKTFTDKGHSFNAADSILDHLNKYHGIEPDWMCVLCNKALSTCFLSENRWQHNCR